MPVSRFGRFTVQSEIGRGAMGVVYRGNHPGLGVPVAIKVLAETFSSDPNFRLRFQREAEAIAALNHPGIVRVYDFDEHEGALFIVMEYVEGRSLRSFLQEYVRFNVDTSLDLIQQLLSAVGAAHQRWIVHRDLKPENVLVTAQGKTKILDFGVSKLVGDRSENLTATGSMVGTPYYMSPEQVRAEDVDRRSDVYALGCMLYELMHGEPPFTGTMASVLHSQVYDKPRASAAIPPPIMKAIWKATEKEASERYATCEEFSGALLNLPLAAAAPSNPPAATSPPPTHAPGQRSKHRARSHVPGDESPEAALVQATDHRKPRIGGCWHTGCTAHEGWACTYVDASKRQCETWWCKQHVVWVEGRTFCPRHASAVKALAVTAGTIREIKHLPAVDDRALPLAALVATDVNKDFMELLRRRYQGRKDVHIAVDPTVRQHFLNRNELAWERSWGALRGNGYLSRIAVRVTTAQPETVQLVIDNGVAWSAVPDWITRHREGDEPDPADRARFRSQLVEVLLDRLDKVAGPPVAGPATTKRTTAADTAPYVSPALLEGMLLRLCAGTTKLTGYELADGLALPFASVERAIGSLVTQEYLAPLGLSADRGPWQQRPLPERMAYTITNRGRVRSDEIGAAGTRYAGPAPVSLEEYQLAVASSTRTDPLGESGVAAVLAGIELVPGVTESIRAAVNSRSSIFIYGAPGNGKTTLARRLVDLLGGPIEVPYAIDLGGGDVLRIFDPSAHKPIGSQPADRRWRTIARPLVQVGGEFLIEMLDPTWEGGSRTYEAPLQVKANGGVLLIDDLGRQRVKPKEILDRLILPMEQGVDFMNLLASGRKIELPFAAQLALSTNLKPGDLLDEAYIRRLAYKIQMPDPSWEMFGRIFDRERERLKLPENPAILGFLRQLYGGRPVRGNHPRDLLERVTDMAAARGVPAALDQDLVEAAWGSMFVAT